MRHVLDLHPVQPTGFYVAPTDDALAGTFHDDLPWFLHDVRPAGYLGRQIPARHPTLDAPRNIALWSADHVLRYAVRHGWDLPGAFLLGGVSADGDTPHARLFAETRDPTNAVPADDRHRLYPAYAEDALGYGVAGSSAAGEQPKFLATRRDQSGFVPVLVKFSPPGDGPVARRMADLLVAEHLALETIGAAGDDTARSSILVSRGRTFLEVERFDRHGLRRRSGVVSLFALDSEFVGSGFQSWTTSAEQLSRAGIVPLADVERVRWRELFGRLIGDVDQHFGNLSFGLRGTQVASLTPAYDVLPSHYSPRGGEVIDAPYRLPPPGPGHLEMTHRALLAAESFWDRVARDGRVSPEFRTIAERNGARVAELREWQETMYRA